MVVKVIKRDGESGEKLLRRFSSHIKSLKLQRKMRRMRYVQSKPTLRVSRGAAISREAYRAENKRKKFLSA